MEERHIYAAAEIEGDSQPTNPSYYAGLSPEPWDVVWRWCGWAGVKAIVLEYLARAGQKPGVPLLVDIRKMINWLQKVERELLRESNP